VLEPRFCRQEGGQRKFRRFRKYLKSFFASLFDTVAPHQYLTIRFGLPVRSRSWALRPSF